MLHELLLADCVPSDVWSEVVTQMLEVSDFQMLHYAAIRLVNRPLIPDGAAFVARRKLTTLELNWFVNCGSIALATTVQADEEAVARVNQKIAIDAKDAGVRATATTRDIAKRNLQIALDAACAQHDDDTAANWAEVRRQHGLYRRVCARLDKLVWERNALKVQLGICPEEDECVWELVTATSEIHQAQPYACEGGIAQVCRYCDHFAVGCEGGPLLHELLTVYGW